MRFKAGCWHVLVRLHGTGEVLVPWDCILHPPGQQTHFARASANQQPVFLCLSQQPSGHGINGGQGPKESFIRILHNWLICLISYMCLLPSMLNKYYWEIRVYKGKYVHPNALHTGVPVGASACCNWLSVRCYYLGLISIISLSLNLIRHAVSHMVAEAQNITSW